MGWVAARVERLAERVPLFFGGGGGRTRWRGEGVPDLRVEGGGSDGEGEGGARSGVERIVGIRSWKRAGRSGGGGSGAGIIGLVVLVVRLLLIHGGINIYDVAELKSVRGVGFRRSCGGWLVNETDKRTLNLLLNTQKQTISK